MEKVYFSDVDNYLTFWVKHRYPYKGKRDDKFTLPHWIMTIICLLLGDDYTNIQQQTFKNIQTLYSNNVRFRTILDDSIGCVSCIFENECIYDTDDSVMCKNITTTLAQKKRLLKEGKLHSLIRVDDEWEFTLMDLADYMISLIPLYNSSIPVVPQLGDIPDPLYNAIYIFLYMFPRIHEVGLDTASRICFDKYQSYIKVILDKIFDSAKGILKGDDVYDPVRDDFFSLDDCIEYRRKLLLRNKNIKF